MFNNIICDLEVLEYRDNQVLVEGSGGKGKKAFGRMLGTVSPGYKEDDLPIDIHLLLFGDVLDRAISLEPRQGDIIRVVGTLYLKKQQDRDGEEVQYLQIIPSSFEFSPCADASLCQLTAEGMVSESPDKEVLKVYEGSCRFTVGTIPPGKSEQAWINLKCLSFQVDRAQKMKLKKGSSLRVSGTFFRRIFSPEDREITYYELIVSSMEYFTRRQEEGGSPQRVRDAKKGEVPGMTA